MNAALISIAVPPTVRAASALANSDEEGVGNALGNELKAHCKPPGGVINASDWARHLLMTEPALRCASPHVRAVAVSRITGIVPDTVLTMQEVRRMPDAIAADVAWRTPRFVRDSNRDWAARLDREDEVVISLSGDRRDGVIAAAAMVPVASVRADRQAREAAHVDAEMGAAGPSNRSSGVR